MYYFYTCAFYYGDFSNMSIKFTIQIYNPDKITYYNTTRTIPQGANDWLPQGHLNTKVTTTVGLSSDPTKYVLWNETISVFLVVDIVHITENILQ